MMFVRYIKGHYSATIYNDEGGIIDTVYISYIQPENVETFLYRAGYVVKGEWKRYNGDNLYAEVTNDVGVR